MADSRVASYEVHYGVAASQYTNKSSTTGTALTVASLDEGKTYYFAARACESGGSNCSGFSNEVSTTIPYAAPVAAFTASPLQGTAPLAVTFADQSTGQISGWSWDFGNGATSTAKSPQYTYQSPGTYTVTLKVTGPGGTNQTTKTGLVTVQAAAAAPVAEFTASTRTGVAPLTVTFSSASQGQISTYSWKFGDGGTSAAAQAAYTYKTPGTYDVSLSVTGPGGADEELKPAYIEVKSPTLLPPTANFSADVLKGPAPLKVTFQNLSSGQVDSSSWSFGDGTSSTDANPVHTYGNPGLYSVTLTVSNSGGTNTRTLSSYIQVLAPDELPIEAGELLVDHQWQEVKFVKSYVDPIVVAKPPSANDAAPAVVRITRVGTTGFKIRVQEWDYLDGVHAKESVSYLVMERGRRQLPDGAWVVAGRLQTSATNAFVSQTFVSAFNQVPIMLAAVTSVNEADAVAVRLRSITKTGFQVGMREQESKTQKHATETIDYIAAEPSFGVVNGMRYEIDLMPTKPTHVAATLIYRTALARAPMFLADMQTTANSEPANLRWRNRNEVGVEVWVAEEQSKDTEVTHVAEQVGYLSIEPAAATKDAPPSTLVGQYRFASDGKGSVTDDSGKGNNGSCVVGSTCPAYVAGDGRPGGSYDFTGNGNYIELANDSSFDFTTSFTVALWMKTSNFGNDWAQLIGKGDSAWSLDRYASTNRLSFTTFAPNPHELVSQSELADGQWHHVAIVYDGQQKILYVDGQTEAKQAYNSPISTNDVKVRLGYNAEYPSGQYDGLLDEVQIYSVALPQEEIWNIMMKGTPSN